MPAARINPDPNTPLSPLPADAFKRYDESADEIFYETPRLVTHIDDAAIEAVTQLYREFLPEDSVILDLMSSWISHLPSDVVYEKVVGLGMNADELAANPRLDEWTVHNLNADPHLPYPDAVFDGGGLCVSIDYLSNPVAVLRDTARTFKPDAPLVVTFSNRCFPTKAIAAWHALDDRGRMALVARFFLEAGWHDIEAFDRSPKNALAHDPLFAVVGRA